MLSRTRILIGSVFAAAIIMASSLPAVKETQAQSNSFCRNYASTAVAQHRANLRCGCGYGKPRFHSNYRSHRRFCEQFGVEASQIENNIRWGMLQDCGC
jgi:hypothetical protein